MSNFGNYLLAVKLGLVFLEKKYMQLRKLIIFQVFMFANYINHSISSKSEWACSRELPTAAIYATFTKPVLDNKQKMFHFEYTIGNRSEPFWAGHHALWRLTSQIGVKKQAWVFQPISPAADFLFTGQFFFSNNFRLFRLFEVCGKIINKFCKQKLLF